MRVLPELALVRPRVVTNDSPEPVLLHELVERRIAQRRFGRVELIGPRGSGRSTALRDLAARMSGRRELLISDGEPAPAMLDRTDDAIVLSAPRFVLSTSPLVERWTLAPWSLDDRIEYVLARHPAHVASVLRRAQTPRWCDLEGHALTWSVVLDELAGDAELSGVVEALQRVVTARLRREASADLVELECTRLACGARGEGILEELDATRATDLTAFSATRGVQLVVASLALAHGLATKATVLELDPAADMLAACAQLLPRDGARRDRLVEIWKGEFPKRARRALELLHATFGAREAFMEAPSASVACNGVRLAGIDLHGVTLERAAFARAASSARSTSRART